MNEVITAPCPFCGSRDAPDVECTAGEGDYWTVCTDCLAQGPVATIGCRDPDEDGPIDLEQEALALWNDRGHPEDEVTVEAILDLAPALEASIEELKARDPEVRAASDRLDATVTSIHERAQQLKDNLTPKELALFEKRFRPPGEKK